MTVIVRIIARMRLALLVAAMLAVLAMPVAAQDALRGVALVIGNGKYEHLAPLPNPENDADGIEELLSDLGFDSVRRSDRTAKDLARDLDRFAEDAEDADVAILYYSGHGIEASGENWLVPVDADISTLDSAADRLVSLTATIERLKKTVPVVIVMLDACRNNPFPAGAVLRTSPDAAPSPIGTSGLIQTRGAVALSGPAPASDKDDSLGTVIAFAAEPGKAALDGAAGGNSPYAAAILRHLNAMAGEEFGTVMRMVAEEVYLKTQGQQRPWINESLRRQLYFGDAPAPVEGEQGEILRERRQLLITIAALPDRERKTIEAVASDTKVPMDALYGMLRALGAEVPEDPAQLDALLRGQTEKVKAMIAERDTLKSSDPEIMRLSGLADEALAEGALTTAIALRQQAKARAKEIESTVEDAEAQLRQRRTELAEVYGKSAEAYALAFKHRDAGRDYEEASRQVERWDEERAFWYMRSASSAYLDAGKLRGGAADLERASETGKRAADMGERLLANAPDDEKQYWQDVAAQTLNNWANANGSLFAATTRSEALEQSIEAYERALKVLNRDRVEQDWAVVQMNLAGALMQKGETEATDDTLLHAVAAYEASLTVWTRDSNPKRWALAASNIANAKSALAKRHGDAAALRESIALLEAALEIQTPEGEPMDWAWTQRELANTYADMAVLSRDGQDLQRSIEANQRALTVLTLERAPRAWAQTMHSIGFAHQSSVDAEDRGVALDKAAALYEQVLAAISPDELPLDYALSLGNLGNARIERGKLGKTEQTIVAGIADLNRSADIYASLGQPREQARFLVDIGRALTELGKLRASVVEPQQAIDIYGKAMQIYRDSNGRPADLDDARHSLAFAEVELAYQRSQAGDNAGAVEAYKASMDHRDRATDLENWLFSANQLAIALHGLGVDEDGVDTLRRAAAAYRTALAATSWDGDRDGWTETQNNLIGALRTIGERSRAVPDQMALADAYGTLASMQNRARNRGGEDQAAVDRAWALGLAGEYGNDLALLTQSADAYRAALKASTLPKPEHLFAMLNFSRVLFLASTLGGGDDARREAVALVDENWPLIDGTGTTEQKVFALIDRASLLSAIGYGTPSALPAEQVAKAYERAANTADPATDPAPWQAAQRAFVTYQLSSVDDPAYPLERVHSGLGALRKLLDATPRQTEPTAWAELANWYGYALGIVGKRENTAARFEEALPLLRDAMTAYETAGDGVSVAHVRDSLCAALVGLGRLTRQRDLVQEGVANCDSSVTTMRAQNLTDFLPIAEANLADARKALAEVGGGN